VQGIEPRFLSSPALQSTFQSLYRIVLATINAVCYRKASAFYTGFKNVYLAPFSTAAKYQET
jgi:hypothetical protein